jgi:hypothetical protein
MIAVDAYEGDVQPDGSGRVWEVSVSDYVPRRKKTTANAIEEPRAEPALSAPQLLQYDQVRELCSDGAEVPRSSLNVLPRGGTRERAIAFLVEKGLIIVREEAKEYQGRTLTKHFVSLPAVPPS